MMQKEPGVTSAICNLKSAMLFLIATLCAVLVACAAPSPPQPPSLELPQPVADLHAVRKGGKVALTWTQPQVTTDGDGIRFLGPTRICRSLLNHTQDHLNDAMTECGPPAAEVASSQLDTTKQQGASNLPARVSARYVDTLPASWMRDPKAFVAYAVESLNTSQRDAGLSNQVQVPAAATEPPPTDFQAQLTSEGVVLTWTGPRLSIPMGEGIPRYFYRVSRETPGAQQQRTLVGELKMGEETQWRLVDRSFLWEKTYEYRINVATHVDTSAPHDCPNQASALALCIDSVDVEGEDSAPVTIVAHDVFPPVVPTGLQAVFSGAGQNPFIDLTWNANVDSDLAGYNIYRRLETGPTVKINTELAKTPAFRDSNVAPGATYFYSIAAVDVRANESARSEEASERVP